MGSLSAHIHLVKLGVRPIAEITVHNSYLPESVAEIGKNGLRMLTRPAGTTHTSVYLFEHPYLKSVIERVESLPPHTAIQGWAYGKMFGYSEQAIARFAKD